MTSFLKGFDKYWQTTAGTHQKLVTAKLKLKPTAMILPYVARQPTRKKIESAELIEERTYILASDMDLPFEWAQSIVKLQAMNRPKTIPQNTWQDIQEAAEQLYRDDFKLLKLIIDYGWEVKHIYGCHPTAPMFRFEAMGLLMLLRSSDKIAEVTEQSIKIRKKSGRVTCFSVEPAQYRQVVMLYELEST